MIGDLAYHLHLRIDVNPRDSFRELLRQVDAEYRAAHDHQDFGWVPTFVPECSDSFVNLDLYFNWSAIDHSWPTDVMRKTDDELRVRSYPLRFDWPVKFLPYFVDTGTDIIAHLRHRPGLLPPETIEQLSYNLKQFANALALNPFSRLPEYVR